MTIKEKIAELNKQLHEAQLRHERAERDGRRLKAEIDRLRNECKHESTRPVTVLDVVEFKERQCCNECGKDF